MSSLSNPIDKPAELLEQIFANMHLAVAYLDCDFNFIRVNQAYARADGREPDFFPGKNHFNIYPNEENEAIFRQVVASGEPFYAFGKPFAYTEHPERGMSYWDWSLQPIQVDGGPVQALLLILENVTQREQSLKMLRESQALLEHLFISDPDGNILVNQQGQITSVNPQIERLFGYSATELVGQTIEFLIPERFHRTHRRERGDYVSHPDIRSMGANLDIIGRRKDGSEFPVDVTLSPMRPEQGLLVLAVVRDISERKQMEAELAEVQRRLFDSIEVERKRLAQELHDGPIQELYGADYQLHALKEASLDEGHQSALAEAQNALHRARGLLRDICSELRPQSLGKFGLAKAIRSYAEQFQAKHPELKVELALDSDKERLPEPIRVALYRNLQQLLTNIVRHAQAKQVHIQFTLDEKRALLVVHDDGRGFAHSGRWLELARQGHLGLVGCSERMEALGGALEVQSAPGKGTTIRSVIPLH